MIDWALSYDGPSAIRYPRHGAECPKPCKDFEMGVWECLRPGRDGAMIASSAILDECLLAADRLEQAGMELAVYNASTLQPLDETLLSSLARQGTPVFTVEEHTIQGGFGGAVAECCARLGMQPPRAIIGLPHDYIPHGSREALLRRLGLDGERIAQKIREAIEK